MSRTPPISKIGGTTSTYHDSSTQRLFVASSIAMTSYSRTQIPMAMIMRSSHVYQALTPNHYWMSSQNSDGPLRRKGEAFPPAGKGSGVAWPIIRALTPPRETPDTYLVPTTRRPTAMRKRGYVIVPPLSRREPPLGNKSQNRNI